MPCDEYVSMHALVADSSQDSIRLCGHVRGPDGYAGAVVVAAAVLVAGVHGQVACALAEVYGGG